MSIGATILGGLSKIADVQQVELILASRSGSFIPTAYPHKDGPRDARCTLRFVKLHTGTPVVRIKIKSDREDSRHDLVSLRSRLSFKNEFNAFGTVTIPAILAGDVWEYEVVVQHTLPLFGLREEIVTEVVTAMLRTWQENLTWVRAHVANEDARVSREERDEMRRLATNQAPEAEQCDGGLIDGPEDDIAEAMEAIEHLVGLGSVKQFAGHLLSRSRLARQRVAQGLVDNFVAPHVVFTGGPGTGKTTVARLMGQAYKALGLLEKGHVVEVTRADLVGQYIGHTAAKTKAVCDSALGGVLFIDEAYSLFGVEKDYGAEAVTTLLTFMENNRGKIALIMAGYPEPMAQLLDSNPGLRSRFDRVLHFGDLTVEELLVVFVGMLSGQDFRYTQSALMDIAYRISTLLERDGAVNARTIRQMVEELITQHALVMSKITSPTKEQLSLITALSVPSVWGEGRTLSDSEFRLL